MIESGTHSYRLTLFLIDNAGVVLDAINLDHIRTKIPELLDRATNGNNRTISIRVRWSPQPEVVVTTYYWGQIPILTKHQQRTRLTVISGQDDC